ncbi:hypothetical protein AB0C34_14260 [Nocardia sp. NPDC049220]
MNRTDRRILDAEGIIDPGLWVTVGLPTRLRIEVPARAREYRP